MRPLDITNVEARAEIAHNHGMENSLRLRGLPLARVAFGILLASGAATWAACGSDATSGTGPADGGLADGGIDTGIDTGPADTGIDTGPVKVYDAGIPTTFDGGVPCVVGGLLEEEPNDTPATANKVDPTRCGTISFRGAGDAGPDAGMVDAGPDAARDAGDAGDAAVVDAGPPPVAESDFLTFTLKPATRSFFIQFNGDVTLKVDVEGKPSSTITPTSAPTLPFVKDKPYFIEVRSNSGKEVSWRVTVFQDE